MASIVTSTIISQVAARGGTRLTFKHTLANGGGDLGPFVEQRPSGSDVNAFVAAHATAMADSLKAAEIVANYQKALNQGVPALTFLWSTVNENLTAVRQAYKSLSGWDCIRLGSYVNSLGLTNTQYTNFFGVSGAALTAFKTKLANAASAYASATAEAGQ